MQKVKDWLSTLGLDDFATAFAEAQVQFSDLIDLTDEDLKEIGLPVGPRRRASSAIKAMNDPKTSAVVDASVRRIEPAQPTARTDTATDAERRHLTVMFVDLVGSTELATTIDPEDMRNVITSYQNTVAGVVSRYEGFVAKFMGDGVLCYFGWPRANEDDAERAVRAGLSIIDSVRKLTAPDGTPCATRVGIATGVVIVGDLIGSGATQEAAVVGETPNLAARLQGVAGPNQLVLPSETRRLLGGAYKMQSLGAQDLKGIREPVEAFVVTGETSRESRFAARQMGMLTPIVGREREIELMLERWSLARSGKGQMVIASGEAGIGKSRITRAVIDGVAGEDHLRMTYQCSPYHADSAFYPVIQQMSFAAGFAPSDDAETRLNKLEALLGTDRATLRLVASLMGLDGSARYGALHMTPAQQRSHTMQALAGLLVQQAAGRPVLLVYEDLHWIDPTSLELLETMLDAIADQRIMILATARPNFDYGFGGHPIVTRFALNRLGNDQIGAIVAKLTGGKAVPDEIMEIIARRTDGVPLFVEELTKTILESGALVLDGDRFVLNGPLSTIAIPSTLHDSLMARLDRLQPIKDVAQTAACIGREFNHRLLAQIARLPEAELTAALDGLIGAELIYRRGLPPEAVYLFKHALVRDAAYESLLKEKRRAIHARILTALEADPDAAPEVRAVHAEAANLSDQAIDLWEAASKAAIARPAYDEAISHLQHAIPLMTPRLDNGDPVILNRALSLQLQLAVASMQRRGYAADETRSAYAYALVLADRIGATPLRLTVLFGIWAGMYVASDHADALRQAEDLLRLAEELEDTGCLCIANRVVGISCMMTGRFREADSYFQRSLSLHDPIKHKGLEHRFGQDIGVGSQTYKGWNAYYLGKTRRSDHHLMLAEAAALETNHINTICYMHAHQYIIAILARNEGAIRRHMEACAPLSEEHKLALWSSYNNIVRALINAGEGDQSGIDAYIEADARLLAIKCKTFLPALRVEAARRALALGLKQQAHNLALMAEDQMRETGEVYALSDLHRLKGTLAMERGDVRAAEASLKEAVNVAKEQGSLMWELRACIDLARLLQAQHRIDEAISVLRPVHDSIEEGDCPDDRSAAGNLLAELV